MSNIISGALDMWDSKEAKAKAITLEKVLKKIKEHTFGCMVAGGYCRDVFHGVTHKDIDICMYNYHRHDPAEVVLLCQLLKWLGDNVGLVDITHQHEQYDDQRINFVWHLPYHNTDIICWNTTNHMQILNSFDCNLNQFYLPSTVPDFESDKPYNPSLEESPVYVGDDCPDFLVFLKELPEERVTKMVQKHQAFYPEAWCGTQEPVAYYEKPTYKFDPDACKSDMTW